MNTRNTDETVEPARSLEDAALAAEKAIDDGPVVGSRWAVPILRALSVLLRHEAAKARQ